MRLTAFDQFDEESWQGRLSENLDAHYEAFVAANERKMLSFALSLHLDETTAQDCVEEAFIAVYGHLSRCSPQDIARYKIVSYLAVAVRNRALDMLKRQAEYRTREMPFPNKPSDQDQDSGKENDLEDIHAPHPEVIYLAKEEKEEFYEQLGKVLKIEDRDLLVNHIGYEVPYEEISNMTGIPVNTLKSRLARSLRLLRNSQDVHKLKGMR